MYFFRAFSSCHRTMRCRRQRTASRKFRGGGIIWPLRPALSASPASPRSGYRRCSRPHPVRTRARTGTGLRRLRHRFQIAKGIDANPIRFARAAATLRRHSARQWSRRLPGHGGTPAGRRRDPFRVSLSRGERNAGHRPLSEKSVQLRASGSARSQPRRSGCR